MREHSETVMDPNTKVDITDTSKDDFANFFSNVREYSMLIDDTYTVSDLVSVTEPTKFEQ